MTGAPGDILDDLFHGCALDAYLEVWRETGEFPPDSERVRRLAYRLYEDELVLQLQLKSRPRSVLRTEAEPCPHSRPPGMSTVGPRN